MFEALGLLTVELSPVSRTICLELAGTKEKQTMKRNNTITVIETPVDREVFTPSATATSATCEVLDNGVIRVTTRFDEGDDDVVHHTPEIRLELEGVDSPEWTNKRPMSLREAIRAVGSEGDLAATYVS